MCNKMSDVRLSNASPTLERVDARQPDNVRPPVRRNLFGRPDREEIRRYVTAAVQEDVQAFAERYNFDPVAERPLAPRNYDWQQDSNAPEFYLRPPHTSHRPQREVDSPNGDERRDGEEETSGRRTHRQRNGGDSRKRRSEDSGSCSDESQTKRSHSDEDDDEDQSDGAGTQAVQIRTNRPENCAEVQ
ncbi:cyclin-dependent kinase inhibitor 1Ba [Stegastes partitus]|uniref:Cyclin-dependent kinase inhibitor 1B n=1 Tax=Stegastes partitus TaxID=144197 RepID=A0A3B5AMC8_9TELE|nr:PREDICTED: cyclin-dependent kinase inhibitor 1B-like [Stegastes partitus]